MIGSAFTVRNASDYDDMFIASKNDTKEQIDNAEYSFRSSDVGKAEAHKKGGCRAIASCDPRHVL